MINLQLIQLLLTQTSITNVVGTRIYPVILPTDSPLPAITLHLITGHSEPTLDTTGTYQTVIQIDCWGPVNGYAQAAQAHDAVVKFLNGYIGTLSDGTRLLGAIYEGPIDMPDFQTLQIRASGQFRLFWTFPAAS